MRSCVERVCPPLPSGRQSISHCTVCHRTFASHTIGDAHRIGPYGPARRCLTYAEMRGRGWRVDARGRWHGAPPDGFRRSLVVTRTQQGASP